MYETTRIGPDARRCCVLVTLSVVVLGLGVGCSSRAASRARVQVQQSQQVASQQVRGQQASTPGQRAAAAARGRPVSPGEDSYARAVRMLTSPDFETRSRAARILVAAGDAALPALGRAGDLPVRVDGGLSVSATRAVVRTLVGESGDPDLLEHLGSPWANVRREAAVELGHRDRWGAVPRLIDHLEDGDGEVRAASAEALRRVTNHFFGYRAEATVAHRRRSADRWRAWWSVQGRSEARVEARRARSEGGGSEGAGGS